MSADGDTCDTKQMYVFKPFVFIRRHPKEPKQTTRTPRPRSGHRISCDDGNVYSFGGYNPYISDDDPEMAEDPVWSANQPLFRELWRFNFINSTWTLLLSGEQLPSELASNALIMKGAAIMVFGGTGVPFGTSCSNKLYVCNIKDNIRMLSIDASGYLPPEQYGQAIVLHRGYLYTVGGTTGYEYSADIHRLNLETRKWEEVYICRGANREPGGRYRHELAFDGNRIFVMGGGTVASVYGFEKIPAFNMSTRRWESLLTTGDPSVAPPGLPAPRRCHGCVQLQSDDIQHASVFISGGYDGSNTFNDMWKLDLSTMQWYCLSQCRLPKSVYFHSTAVTPAGELFSFGGIADMGEGEFDRTAEVHSVWVCIPKLSEICWEALLHYCRSIHTLPTSNLLDCGIPAKFISRLEQTVQLP